MHDNAKLSNRRYSAPRTVLAEYRKKPISHECLREHAFFKGRDPKLLDILLDNISVEIFLPGAEILTEGSDGDAMYFLYNGEVEVCVGPDRKRVAVLKDGNLFGEMALFGNGKRAATIRAVEVCDCRVITAAIFHASLKRFPAEKAFFQRLAKDRLAELKTVKANMNSSKQSPAKPSPSAAVGKFRKASHAIMASDKLKARSHSPRAATWPDDLTVSEDQALSRLWMTSVADTQVDRNGVATGQGRSAMSLCSPASLLKFVAPSSSRRSSAAQENKNPKSLDMAIGICPSGEPVLPRSHGAPNNRRRSTYTTHDPVGEAANRKRFSDITFDRYNQASNGRCWSDFPFYGTKRTVGTKPVSDTNFDRAPLSQLTVTELMNKIPHLPKANPRTASLRTQKLCKYYQ